MDAQSIPDGQRTQTLHCRECDAFHPCTLDDLESYLNDDPTWPRCCGQRMTTILPDRGDAEAGDFEQ